MNNCESILSKGDNSPESAPDYTWDENVVCPYCKRANRDSWELGDGGEGSGETECDCGKTFIWVRHISVSYEGKPKDN